MPIARVHRLAASGPDDASGLEAAIQAGAIDPGGILAIFGKTEGNGCVNDFSRGFATQSLSLALARHIGPERAAEVCYVMSGGTEGAMSPHWTVFERVEGDGLAGPALAIGRVHTAALPAEALGRLGQVDQVAEAVRAAMRQAAIEDPEDVHFVQIKCPLLTNRRIGEAEARGVTVAVRDTLKSMGLSRGASSLGVAVALGEVPRSAVSDVVIGRDFSLWSARASASAGVELSHHEVVVLGRSAAWSGLITIDHAVMADAIDIEPVRAALARVGLPADGQLDPRQRSHLVALLAKAEASPDGELRGERHTMLDDSDISSTRHARAYVAGALGGLVGRSMIYVSGGAEHQGPPGGGPVAVIVER
ncbi:ring-opening amidohydrolase [Phreatobacter stygius]|uniref:Cyanuric acid amidohydrolase n=1 Tax=Phreatobacter stygius TaxID=1940610 RepID=A0A4D7AZA2_9HYPH|nr:ring-opening amidohydrolase [Phreatobacter stygius]QCI64695.1 ring-opening amidohydrolase [Phreatobacter stygius]